MKPLLWLYDALCFLLVLAIAVLLDEPAEGD
jgi:hypothetical protein